MPQDENVSVIFACESCETEILLDDETRLSLLKAGTCILCKEPISEENFERYE